MHDVAGVSLAPLTTLRLGGPAGALVEAENEQALVEAVRSLDDTGRPLLVLSGGSNVVIADGGFDGTVVLVRTSGIDVRSDISDPDSVVVTVQSGEDWDEFVARAVVEGWVGVEALSGIPGRAGAAPIQNVGAYGQEVAQTIRQVRTYDRRHRRIVTYSAEECGFAYRDSRFKADPGRHVVLSVTFTLPRAELAAPIAYAELARDLGVDIGDRVPTADVRDAVLRLRRGKAMVLDADDHDTWSAGSFFTNPVLGAEDAAGLPDGAPRFEQPDGRVKTSAAWLIGWAGFEKGYGAELGTGRARLSGKHPLALTNRGGATTRDLLRLARCVRDGVRRSTGVTLVNEPVLVGCSLDDAAGC